MSGSLADELALFDPSLPLSQAKTIPNSWYHSQIVEQGERQKVFGESWLSIGRSEQVANPGDYLTLEMAGEPILVLRGSDGQLRAFFNVCRHRAAPLLNEPCGHVSKIRCRYHGWTYDLEGRLRGTPEFDRVDDFCKETNGLVPMTVGEWGGFVWVHLGEPKQSLGDYLHPLPDWIKKQPPASLKFARRVSYDLKCNWKVYVDNYLDGGYHVNTVHPALAGVLDYTKYRTEVYERCSAQISPLIPGDPNDPASKTRTGTEAAYWWIFPNFMINLYSGVMDTNLVLPTGTDSCRVLFDYYFAPSTPTDFIEESIAVAHQVQLEDMLICEEVQRGLHSRSYSTGRFSVKREAGGYHFHQLLAKYLGEET
jgi:choline monooxygenase